MRLNELPNGELGSILVPGMMSTSNVLQLAEFYQFTGNSDTPRKKATATGGAYRAIDDTWADNKVSPQFGSVNLKIFGGKVQVDRAHIRRQEDLQNEIARQFENFAKDFGKNFQDEFFNGDPDVNANSWNGIRKLVPDAQKIVPTEVLEVVPGNSNEAIASQQKFIEYIRQLIRKVDGGAQVIYMTESAHSRLTTIAAGFIRWEKNEFGMLIPYFDGVPVLTGGYDASGNLVIPENETVGEVTGTTTLLAMRFGEKIDLTVGTSVGIDTYNHGIVGNHFEWSVELDADLALLNNKALASLSRIKIS